MKKVGKNYTTSVNTRTLCFIAGFSAPIMGIVLGEIFVKDEKFKEEGEFLNRGGKFGIILGIIGLILSEVLKRI